MNGKNPISALQELTAAKKIPLPQYIEEISLGCFKCTVHAAGVTGVGVAASKKIAKYICAQNALDKLGIANSPLQMVINTASLPSSSIKASWRNYVGELNEFASKHGISYPKYESTSISAQGEFFISCSFMGRNTVKKGLNKKDAKQESAKAMLDLVGTLNVTAEVNKTIIKKIEVDDSDKQKIMKIFEALSINRPTTHLPQSQQSLPSISVISLEHDSIDVLKEKLSYYNIQYTLKKIQSRPYIIHLKVSGTDLSFLASGETKEEATRKVLYELLDIAETGVCLSNNDLLLLN